MTSNQVVSTMFDIRTSIHMDQFVLFQDWDEDLGLGDYFFMCFTHAAMEII
jgi:hypothetical protein